MRTALSGLFTYIEFGACALTFIPLIGAARLANLGDPTHRKPGQWLRRMGRVSSSMTPLWNFEVLGERPADIDTKGYLVVANHESTADPFLLSWLPWDMRWVGKEEIFKLPVLGLLVKFAGDIPIKRGSRESVIAMKAECVKTLQAGMSVMMFPEGTRSEDGSLGPFKDGAFQIAIEAQVPVLPVAVEGTRACRPKGSIWFGKAYATARVLEPVPTAGMTLDDMPRLREMVRTRIASALGRAATPPVDAAKNGAAARATT